MADNTTLNSGSGGDTIASDDIGGIKFQRVKPAIGADGTAVDAIPISNGLDTTATGVQAVGLVAQLDDTATGAVTENQFAPVRLSSRRALLVEGVASGTAVSVTSNSANIATETTVSALAGDVGDTADAAATAGSTGTLHAKQRLMTSQLDSIKTAVETLDNAISGSEMQVDVVAALPAGTNAIGKLAANSGVDIGDVDVTSVIAGTGATNLGKAVDAVAGATDTGVALLVVRDDSLTTLTPIDGDYTHLRVSSTGALHVTGGGGGTEYTADADAPDTPTGATFVMERDDALSAVTPIEGDWIHPRGSANGALWVAVDGSVAVTNAGLTELAAAIDTELQVDVVGALPAGTNNIGDVDVLSVVPGTGATNLGKAIDTATGATDTGVLSLATRDDALSALTPVEGDNIQLRVDANGALWVIPSGTVTVSGTVTANLAAGTNNVGDVDVLSIAAGDNNIGNVDIVSLPASTNTLEVVGDVAHDAAAAGNPVLIAGVAQNTDDTAPPNRVSAESDATHLATDLDGALFVRPYGPQVWSYHSNGSTALTDASVHAAPGAGLSLYVTDIVCSSGAATAMNVFFEEGASTVLGPYYLEAVAGRGLHIKFGTPKKITANTALTVTTSAAIAHSVDVTGFTAQG